MSGSEMGNRDQFPLGFQKPQQQPHPQLPSIYAPDAAAAVYNAAPAFHQSPTVAAHVNGGESAAAAAAFPQGVQAQAQAQAQGQLIGSSSEPLKRKRGRPRKYGPDGAMSLSLTNTSPPAAAAAPVPSPAGSVASQLQFSPGPVNQSGGQFSPVGPPPGIVSPASSKKGRGRPRGSRNKTTSKRRKTGAGSRGRNYITPHTMTVKAGEDLSSKIVALSESGPRNVFIMSANGPISNVALHQPATTAGAVAYEGRFEILSLNGSFVHNESGGQHSRRGGLSVALSGPDGRVLGGGVAGLMIAAAPVQLVLGSFPSEGPKEPKSASKMENASAPTSTAGQSSSPSGGSVSESSDDSDSPLDQSTGACNDNTPQGISGMPWK